MHDDQVTITVRYFAAAREGAGTAQEELTLAAGATVGDLKRLVGERHSSMAALLDIASVLVDGTAADPDTVVSGIVDVLPPFAGG